MKNLVSSFYFKFITFSLLFTSFVFAKQVNVSTTDGLVQAALNSKAGDTIWVAPGKYELGRDLCNNDTFVNSTGRDCGLIWLGNSGTKEHPIVLVGKDPANPPDIYGTTIMKDVGIHITGDYVFLKNLRIHTFSKGVVFDNANDALLEDCEVFNTGTEIIHVRDSSQRVVLNRNLIHRSGFDIARYGEGIYVGTYHTGWASSQQSDKNAGYWGSAASQHRYSGYDWRVDETQITCNVVKATTAENVDIKEGTRNGLIKGNMFVGDWTNTQLVGPYDSDDSNIDMKGSYWKVKDNYMYNSKKIGLPYYNPHFRYFVEEVVMRGDNVKKYENAMGYYVTADNYAQNGWCDNSSGDKNECLEADNKIVESIREVRNDCKELFVIPGNPITYSNVDFDVLDSNRVSSIDVFSPDAGTAASYSSYEAENALLENCYQTLAHDSASGGKYVITKGTGNITFSVNVPKAGYYEVLIRYSNTSSQGSFQGIYLNDSSARVARPYFPLTLEGNVGTAKAAFSEIPVVLLLKQGDNTIKIQKEWGYVDIDKISVPIPQEKTSSSSSSNQPIVSSSSSVMMSSSSFDVTSSSSKGEVGFQNVDYEAENAQYVGSMCEEKTHATASGGKYIRTVTDCDITFNNVEVPSAGTYNVVIRFSNTASNAKYQYVYVNGSRVAELEFPVTLGGNVGGANAAFEDKAISVSLNAGKNTLAIMKSWGHVDIDKISVSVPQDNPVSSSSSSSVVSSSSLSAPTLADVSYSVEENSMAGLVLGTLVATDPDESAPNNTLTYKVLSGNNAGMFALSDAGKLSVAKDGLDYETITSYTLTVQVSDAGTPSLKDTAIVKISVLNVNEKPEIADASYSVEENSVAGLVLGTLVATDPDESAPNNTLTYKVLSGNNAGMFTLSDAGKLNVAKDGLDYETVTSYTLTVQVSDAGTPSLSDTAIVKISVLNVNEKPVVIESSSSISLPSSSSNLQVESSSSEETILPSSSSMVVESSSSSSSLQVESSSSEEIILPSSSSTVVESSSSSSSLPVESSSSEETILPSSSSIDESSSSAVLWIEYRNSLNLFKVMVQEKNLLIDNLSQIETYNVLDLQGRLICSGRLIQGINSIYLQNSGIYLVKIGNAIQKIKIH